MDIPDRLNSITIYTKKMEITHNELLEEMSVPTLEYTRSVCTCGKELSSLYYYITNAERFNSFAREYGLEHTRVPFTTLDNIKDALPFCCLLSLRFGIKTPIASATDSSENTGSTIKYPSSLPGPLSKEKILTWF
jgi:hypothetical protein